MTDFNSSDRDVSRAIRSWLHEDRHEDASRLAGAVLDEVDSALSAAPTGALTAVLLHHHVLPLPEESLPERFATRMGWPHASELALGAELGKLVPGLRQKLVVGIGTKWEGTIGLTTRVLFLLATFIGPTVAALIVTGATEGRAGVRRLLKRFVQWRAIVAAGVPLYYAWRAASRRAGAGSAPACPRARGSGRRRRATRRCRWSGSGIAP